MADIARWDPAALGQVADTAKKLAVSVDETVQPLPNLHVFGVWTGTAADSARWAMKDTHTKADGFEGAVKILGGAASIAQGVVEGLVRALVDIRIQASAHGFRINEAANTVEIAISTAHWSDEDFAQLKADQRELQARVDKLVEEANRVDDDLAKALSVVGDEKVFSQSGEKLTSLVVGTLVGAKTDLLAKYGSKALEAADSSLKPWLKEISLLQTSRIGVVGNVAMMIPAVIQDVGQGDSVAKAVTREAAGTAAGVAASAGAGWLASAATGAIAGSALPGPGTVIGAGVGIAVAALAGDAVSGEVSDWVGKLWG
ncbi:hypothetical protein [uncultured Williamsia sp.]|uniref:hypothetical protein n=1 Tax=uncultured Williamsia sp. TaxID=259311 RepID=UPI00261475C5|nr:hypothetical protein [uncultured Williamsia sp.]